MKVLAKIAAVAVSMVMAASAFGCASSDTTSQANPGFEPQDIEIQNPGYVITDEGTLRFAFVAVNPNEGQIAKDVVFTIEAYDANGSMIAGDNETISALYPGTETAGAGETELFSLNEENPKVSSLSIVAIMDSITWSATTITDGDLEDSIDIVKPRSSSTDSGDVQIKASITLAEGDDMKLDASAPIEFRAVALLFDDDGNAICGTSPVVFTLSPDSNAYDFEAAIANPPQYAECNLYVTPSA